MFRKKDTSESHITFLESFEFGIKHPTQEVKFWSVFLVFSLLVGLGFVCGWGFIVCCLFFLMAI